MPKKITREDDEKTLTKKVQEGASASEAPGANAALRTLRKRLKRTQRKRRRLDARKRRGLGKNASAPSAAGSGGASPA